MGNTITGGTLAATGSGLCSLAQCKAALKLTTTASDTLVADLIDAATRWAQHYAGRDLVATDYVELFSPGFRGGNVSRDMASLRPKNFPIISVAGIHQDAERVFGVGTLIPAADYSVGLYAITLYNDAGTRALVAGQGTVRLAYRAGYETVPADLARAGVMLTVHLFHAADRQKQGLASESIGDHTLTFTNETMPKEAAAILDLYKRPCGL